MTADTDPVYHCYENESSTYVDEHGVERFKSGLGKVIREYRTNFADEAVRNCNTQSEDWENARRPKNRHSKEPQTNKKPERHKQQ